MARGYLLGGLWFNEYADRQNVICMIRKIIQSERKYFTDAVHMQLLGFGLDFERIVHIGQVVVIQVQFAHNPEYFRTLDFFLILRIHFGLSKDGSSPKLANFGYISIGLEFIRAIFENLIKFIEFDAHVILLYNPADHGLHFLLLFNEFDHEMENIGTDVPPELLLSLRPQLSIILLQNKIVLGLIQRSFWLALSGRRGNGVEWLESRALQVFLRRRGVIESQEFVVVGEQGSRHKAHLFRRQVAYLVGHMSQEGIAESF